MPDIEYIIKHLKKTRGDWSSEKIESEAEKILKQYLFQNKDLIKKREEEGKAAFNKALDREFLYSHLDHLDQIEKDKNRKG